MTSSCKASQSSGFGIRACAIVSTPQLPVSYVNQGYPVRNSSGFCSCATWVIQHPKPQAALIQTWSGNEPWTREMADLSFARAMAVADTARRNRCVPILGDPSPMVGTNPEAAAHRQPKRIRARAAAQPRGYLLDLDTLWGTGATPNTYRREYDWGDQVYPNDAARAATARVLVRCCGRSSAGCSGRPRSPRLAAVRVAQSS